MFLILSIGLIAAGAIPFLAYYLPAYLGYLLAAILPLSAGIAVKYPEYQWQAGILC